VWAELTATDRSPATPGTTADLNIDVETLLGSWTDEEEPSEPLYTVRLGAVPTELLPSAKAHIDNVVRELTLARSQGSGPRRASAAVLARLIEAVTRNFTSARAEINRQALQAAARGQTLTELVCR